MSSPLAALGYAISTDIIKSLKVAHAFECSTACLSNTRCRSVNYHRDAEPMGLCEFSSTSLTDKEPPLVKKANSTYYRRTAWDYLCRDEMSCKNGGRCIITSTNYNGYKCENFSPESVKSCKDIFKKYGRRKDMVYTFHVDSKEADVYCHMTSICGSGGWTLVMKANGSKDTFQYTSQYWSNKIEFNPEAGLTGLDGNETMLSTYWGVPFDQICLGMKVGDDLNWLTLDYNFTSLYDAIADGNFRNLSMARDPWLALIAGSKLQRACGMNGFNPKDMIRIGIIGNHEWDCNTPDSYIGIGAKQSGYWVGNYCMQYCKVKLAAFGYIFVK
ncbi:uncharacterized skeletal organic matrix protein 5 isoform X2 [Nematostella vectensis]|uniref:uncharacterized skeletal organic matrix protein 5 isoform X2 n=1 Tax=Nematostella vectensis TaxID=45351 RepID=UPI0020773BB7|nr:uncharacterized skeletal organic matrix protein 5 isoform X2 [Nematostella vectensis]